MGVKVYHFGNSSFKCSYTLLGGKDGGCGRGDMISAWKNLVFFVFNANWVKFHDFNV